MDSKKISEIREVISKPQKFERKSWKKWRKANCYMYVLNYRGPHELGDIGFSENEIGYYDNDILVERLYQDMESLGIKIREANYQDIVEEEEWKIAVFSNENMSIDFDFHFMREDEPKRWSHKFRWELPKKTDFSNTRIIDPRIADVRE